MKKPVLVVMAAGMGSRYGGLKQIDPVGSHGQLIIDYSIYDAKRAGFETVVFVIKHEIEETFKSAIGDRLSTVIDVKYAYQELADLPEGYSVPEGRIKPWGTCHAILAARKVVDGPFAVVNSDDYYGPEAFKAIHDYLRTHEDSENCYEFAMVGYRLDNTVTEHGHVARGICVEDENHFLQTVTERTHIEKDGADARYTEDHGANWHFLAGETIVSMNLWGFKPAIFDEIEKQFIEFLSNVTDTKKQEFYIPSVVDRMIKEKGENVTVLTTDERWYGVTYKEDTDSVRAAIKNLQDSGMYDGI